MRKSALALICSGVVIVALEGALWADGVHELHPLEPAETSSPRATLKCFQLGIHDVYDVLRERGMRRGVLSHSELERYEGRVLGCLDLSQVPPTLLGSQAQETVACLKEVLDRIELPPESEWPDAEMVKAAGLEHWTIPHTEITLVRMKEGPKEGQFLFSASTVDQAASFYERVRHLPYQDRPTVTPDMIRFYLAEPGWMLPRNWIKSLPDWVHRRPGGQAVWQWIGLAISLLSALAIMLMVYLVGMRRSRRFSDRNLFRYMVTLVFSVLAMGVPLLTKYFVRAQLRITGDALVGLTYALDIVFLFALMMFVLGAGNRLAALIVATPWVKPRGLDAQMVRLTCRIISITATVIVLLEGGQQIGIPLTTLLAGAGVSGLALALAAQDMLKNVFGSIMISLDKPYRVDERIVVKGYDGVVEEVGLRSTKIRLLTGHLTTIPNEEMARSDIENIGRRDSIRHIANIAVPLDTPPKKVEEAVKIVQAILDDHEGLNSDFPPRVFFDEVNRDSFNIRVMIWYHPANYWDFMAFKQRVNHRIVEAFEAKGIAFAPPTNVTYVAQPEDYPLRFHSGGRTDSTDVPPHRS